MHVITSPTEIAVSLFESDPGGPCCVRVLIFREGLLSTAVIALLRRVLAHL